MTPKKYLGKLVVPPRDDKLDQGGAIFDDAWWDEINRQIQAMG